MARQLADGVWVLELGLFPPLASNAFLVDDARSRTGSRDGRVTLVDAGSLVNRPTLRDELAAAGYGPADVDQVLLTHYDLDHVGGLRTFGSRTGLPVYIGRPDYRLATGESDPPLLHHKGLFHRLTRRFFPIPDGFDLRPVDDGERIGQFTAFVTPGHNPGHTVYVHDAGVAFLGDLVWEDDGTLTTPIRFDSYDVAEIDESVRALAERCPEFEVAAMAHGTPIESGGYAALRALADRC